MINCAGIILWAECASIQDSLVLCQDPLGKGTTKKMSRDNIEAKFILGAGKIILCIIIVEIVTYYEVHELVDIMVKSVCSACDLG